LVAACLSACGGAERDARPRLSLAETLAGADTAGYARALAPRDFEFPLDHGPHPEFRTEWWYVTGNLGADDGRDFGFQLTIFRSALAPPLPESPSDGMPARRSAWATNQVYMGHFSVTDVSGARFHAFERFARGAVGLAGASAEPLRVWVEEWEIEGTPGVALPLSIRAADSGVALALRLDSSKRVVLHGERGLSQKGPEPGNASYYYSLARLQASGTLVMKDDTLAVRGRAWLDREWSTSALSEGQVGWDWFGLQLDDGWDLMLYRLRRADGSAYEEWSEGTLVDPSGASTRLAWGRDVTVEATGTWTSPIDGAVYPQGWIVTLPSRRWRLEVEPRLSDQELDLAFRYWEGAVSVRGTGVGGGALNGMGYVELTGYAGEAPGR
jgi:predicted secreted hydrolase